MTAGFDEIAAICDDLGTTAPIGQLQRAAFWRHVGPLFVRGASVLDLGCGTGEDAALLRDRGVSVKAIDSSPEMVRMARNRGVDARLLRIEDIACMGGKFDGAISNFGGLNCVKRLPDLREPLARLIRPGGYLALCLMGRFCLWETIRHSLHGQFRNALRRGSGEASSSPGLTVYYPGVGEIREALSPAFTLTATAGIGVCVPPSYVRGLSAKTLGRLDQIDANIALWKGIAAFADYRLTIFRRS